MGNMPYYVADEIERIEARVRKAYRRMERLIQTDTTLYREEAERVVRLEKVLAQLKKDKRFAY